MWEMIVAKANVILPKAVDAALRITGAKLFGKLLAIPEAWADGKIQIIKDKTEARSIISRSLADSAAKSLAVSQEVVAAFSANLMSDFERKTANASGVFKKAVEHLSDGTVVADEHASPPEDGWLHSFQRFAEDASSDKLQDLLARILAGEISRGGSYSLATLRVISELDKEIADKFSSIYSEAIDDRHIFRANKYSRSPWWDMINSLRDAGFVSAAEGAIHNPPLQSPTEIGFWSVGAGPSVLIKFKNEGRSEIPIFTMTKMGVEVGTLLPKPDHARNLRSMVAENPFKGGWLEVSLLRGGQIAEVIFSG